MNCSIAVINRVCASDVWNWNLIVLTGVPV